MKPNRIAFFAAALAGFAVLWPAAALASGCEREVVARIKTSPGQSCWVYRGDATTFVGKFANGQRVSAEMRGEESEYDPRSGAVATAWRARDPNVEGPGGYYFGDAQAPGMLNFIAPANGTYRFSFSPCAMWGAPGVVKICAK